MSSWRDSERIAVAVHALTGHWLSGGAARELAETAASRGEMLAKGIVDLDWLQAAPAALRTFAELAASALPATASGEDKTVAAPSPAGTLSREVALSLIERHREDPTATHPFDVLAHLASRGRHDRFARKAQAE